MKYELAFLGNNSIYFESNMSITPPLINLENFISLVCDFDRKQCYYARRLQSLILLEIEGNIEH